MWLTYTHFLTAERRLAECFKQDTASDTWWRTTVKQAIFAWNSNFGDFCVAPLTNDVSPSCTIPSGGVRLTVTEVY
jgi:hypothetical protein